MTGPTYEQQEYNTLLKGISSSMEMNLETTKKILDVLTEFKEQQKETNRLLEQIRDMLPLE